MGRRMSVGHAHPRPRSAEPSRGRPGPVRPRARSCWRPRCSRLSRWSRPRSSSFQVGAYSLILGMHRAVADVPRRLWRHGQPAADQRAGLAGYVVAILGTNNSAFSASAGRGGCWCRSRCCSPARVVGADRCSRRAHRGHLHDHDHARDRRRLLLLRPAELRAFNGHSRLRRHSRRRASSASTGAIPCPSTISACCVAAVCYAAVVYMLALDLRPGAAGDPRQSAAACARSASTSRRTGSPPTSLPASSPGSPACCSSGSTAASRRAPSASAQAIDILVIAVSAACAIRSGRSSARSFFVLLETFAIDIVGAERFNTLIGLMFLAIVFVFAGRAAGPVGESAAAPCDAGVPCAPATCRGTAVHIEAQQNRTQGGKR